MGRPQSAQRMERVSQKEALEASWEDEIIADNYLEVYA